MLPPLRLTGARVLVGAALEDAAIRIEAGRIGGSGGAREVDLSGFWLLPGIVDLHGDGFERHLAPRPSAPFDKARALLGTDAELGANGVTTAWLAQSWSWEGGTRGPDYAEDLMAAHGAVRRRVLADMRLQIRLETHVLGQNARILEAVRRWGIDYVVFNNHLPEGLALSRSDPARFASWAAQQGRSAETMLAIVTEAAALGPEVPEHLAALGQALGAAGVRLGSHDDGDAATRAAFRRVGADIAEFPTSAAAAAAAKAAGEPVVMGAPNVVRGGSQAGNVAAAALLRAGLCDALVSDYYYPALAQAVWRLLDEGVCDIARGWALVSERPAAIFGLGDRGRIGEGMRADLVVVDPESRRVEATIAGGRIAWLSGEAGRRFVMAAGAEALAAP